MTRRKAKRKAPPKPRYVVRKLDPIEFAPDIERIIGGHFSAGSGERPTAFIGMAWWGAFNVTGGIDEIVGVASMCHSAVEEGSFYLARCAVTADHRGHGLQRMLIKARVARAVELKGTHCSSDTYENPASTNNLIACGFRAYKPVQVWRGEGTMYWRLLLQAGRKLKL
jgi:GNAT superfamily N-acetyltransferase